MINIICIEESEGSRLFIALVIMTVNGVLFIYIITPDSSKFTKFHKVQNHDNPVIFRLLLP